MVDVGRRAPDWPAVPIRLEGGPGAELVIDIRNPLPTGPAGPVATSGTGTGLVGLAERAQPAGGELEHGATAAGEFRLRAALPWPA